jgi:hypothetical protein
MSSNPKSVNYRPLTEGEGEYRAIRRAHVIAAAVAASTGQAGLDEGDAAKDAMKRSQK